MPDLYNALSAASGGFLNQRTQQPGFGPPGVSQGSGPSSAGPQSPMSPNGDNMYAPSSQAPLPQPEYRSNPVVTQDSRAVNQQPFPQPNPAPSMPGMYGAMQKNVGGSPGMPSPTVENSPNMNGQSLYRSIVNP